MPQLQGYGLRASEGQHEEPLSLDPGPLVPVGFALRATAQLLDLLVGFVVAFVGGVIGAVVLAVLARAGLVADGWIERMQRVSALSLLAGTLSGIAYHTVAEGVSGVTIGKAICGMRVLAADQRPCTIAKAFGRALAFYIDSFFFGLVAYGAMNQSTMKQRLGDRWASTIVVTKSSASAIPLRNFALGTVLSIAISGLIQMVSIIASGR